MRIESFKESEWLEIVDIISAHCPSEPIIEKLKGGKGLTKRLSLYSSVEGKGMVQFKKDYQEYILKNYSVRRKDDDE